MAGKVLVTGASGFIGRRLVSRLLESGHSTMAGSRGETNIPGALPLRIPVRSGVLSFEGLLGGIDAIFHFAGVAHFGDSARLGRRRFLQNLWSGNVASAANLAAEAVRAGVRRVIFCSSIGAFASAHPEIIRHDLPEHPDSDYGKSKLEAERVMKRILESSGSELVILRPPMVYGPGSKANMRNLIRLVNCGVPIPLGAVSNRRSLIFIDNLVSLLVLILRHPVVPPWPVLASDGADVSTPDLIRTVGACLGKDVRLTTIPLSVLHFLDRVSGLGIYKKLCANLFVDIQDTQEFYRWRPETTLFHGLRMTIEDFLAKRS